MAAIYDMKADPANREIMSFTEAGDAFSMYYLRARTQGICGAVCEPTR